MSQMHTSDKLADRMEKARRHWRKWRKAGAGAVPPIAPGFRPLTIAISREAGASGAMVARMLGEKLGWAVYDRELLQKIAEEMGLRTELVEGMDEKRGSWLRECMETFSTRGVVTENAYVRHLMETLLSLAAHGECVIVGRGAPQVLPPDTTLRVRLVCPRRDRIEVARQKHKMTFEEAERWIDTTDRDRTAFVRDHFLKDPGDPGQYDIVLNTSRFTLGECVDLLVEALHRLEAREVARRDKQTV